MEESVPGLSGIFLDNKLLNSMPPILPDEVHLFHLDLDLPESALRALAWNLTDEERDRARGMRFQVHRRRFVAAHGILNLLLSRYLSIPTSRLRFAKAKGGKPMLGLQELPFWQETPRPQDLRFNLSHSGDKALLAFAIGSDVGVDLEEEREDPLLTSLVSQYFSRGERDWFSTLEPEERTPAFYQCWTLKEAYLKAVGAGLAESLDSFDAYLRGEEVVFSLPENPRRGCSWLLRPIMMPDGFKGALAFQGKEFNLIFPHTF